MWPYCFCDYIYTTLFVGKLAFSKLNASDYGDLSDTQNEGTKKFRPISFFDNLRVVCFPFFQRDNMVILSWWCYLEGPIFHEAFQLKASLLQYQM